MNATSITRRIAIIMTLNFAARGLALPFVNLYLDSIGFSGAEIGTLLSLTALLDIVLMPLLLRFADRQGNHRSLLKGLIIGTSFAVMGLVGNIGRVGISGMVLLRNFTDKPNAVLTTQLTITKLSAIKRDIYGRLRAWGSLGWAITTFCSGFIFNIGGYALLFILSALLGLAMLPFLTVFPKKTSTSDEDIEDISEAPPRKRGFYYLLLVEGVFWGAVMAYQAFLVIYMKNELDASGELIGMAISIGALTEVPVMIMMDGMLRRYDIRSVYLIGIIGLSLQMFSLALITTDAFIIPLMMMRGLFYSLQTVSKTLLVARISHPSNVSANQSLMQTTVPAIAIILTGSLMGWIYDNLGGDTLFTILMVVGLLSAGFVMMVWSTLESQPVQTQLDDEIDHKAKVELKK